MSAESGKFYAGRNEAGYDYIEKRTDNKEKYQEWVEDFLAWGREKLRYIAENVTETWHQIEANELPEERAVELRRALVYALGLSATIMSPNKQEVAQAYDDSDKVEVVDTTTNVDTPGVIRINLADLPETNFNKTEEVEQITQQVEFTLPSEDMVQFEAEQRRLSPNFYAEIDRIAEEVSERRLATGLENAAKPVIGAEDLSRELYLMQEINFEHPDTGRELPEVIQEELRRYVVAQVFRESTFDNSSVNPVTGAFGSVQAMVATAIDEGYNPRELRLSFIQQVEFMGGYYARMYGWLYHHTDDEAMNFLKRGLTEEEFQRDVLVPILINAYNAGVGTMSTAINEYYQANRGSRLSEGGKDRYMALVNFAMRSNTGSLANYRHEAGSYVTMTYGEREAMERYRQRQDGQAINESTFDNSL